MKAEPIWIVLGVLLVAYLGIYFGVTSPTQAKTAKILKQIDGHIKAIEISQQDPVPGKPMLDAFENYKKSLAEGYENIAKFYLEKDKKFESWFTELGITKIEDEPQKARLDAILNDRIDKTKNELTGEGKDLIVGNGAVDEFERKILFVRKSSEGLRIVQKSWWMFEHFLNTAKNNNVHRILNCEWEKPDFEETILGRVKIMPEDGNPPVDEKVFGYTIMKMESKLEIPHSHITLFLESLLASTEQSKVLVGLRELKISKQEQKKSDYVRKKEAYWEKSRIEAQNQQSLEKVLKKIQKEQKLASKDVILEIEFFVYDFFERVQKIPPNN